MSQLRESFVERFGEANALAIEGAADQHRAELLDGWKHGDDPFADALSVAIGFECVSRYRKDHGIEAPEVELRDWAIESKALVRRIGPIDHLALVCGAYDPWIPQEADQ